MEFFKYTAVGEGVCVWQRLDLLQSIMHLGVSSLHTLVLENEELQTAPENC